MLLLVVLAELSEGGIDAKGIAMLGVLAACGAALRTLGGDVTGASPVFFLLMPAGRVLGRGFGFTLGALTLFGSALLTGGVGPWLPFQMLAAGWIGLLAGCLPRATGRLEVWLLATYGAIAGLLYGAVTDLWFWPFATSGLSPQIAYLPGASWTTQAHHFVAFYLATSLGWDIPRALANAVLVLVAGRPVLLALRRAARKAAFGADVAFEVDLGEPVPDRRRPERVLVLGGARSGKSATAERLLAAEPTVCYVATSSQPPGDTEWAERIATHKARRPPNWTTVETADLAGLLRQCTAAQPPLLIDCLTVWLARVMDDTGVWLAADEVARKAAEVALEATVDDLVSAWRTTTARVVAVSNEVGSGIVPDTQSGRRFRDALGTLNARLAAASDDVVLVTAGIARSLLRDRTTSEPW
jgi:energy-coupling factor transport system substrate-specific component